MMCILRLFREGGITTIYYKKKQGSVKELNYSEYDDSDEGLIDLYKMRDIRRDYRS